MDDNKYMYIYEMIGDECLVHDIRMGAKMSGKNPEALLREKLKRYADFEGKSDPEAYSKIDWDADITQLVNDLKQIRSNKMGKPNASVQSFLFYVLEGLFEITRVVDLDDGIDDDSAIEPDEK